MISVLVAVAAIVWLMRSFKRNPAFFLVAIFLAWQFALKIFGVVFLDNFGPIYSSEVVTEVGGIGSSAPLMVLFVMIPFFVLKVVLSRFSLQRPPPPEANLAQGGVTLGDMCAYVLFAFVACLYIDLLRLGHIPFLEKMERFEYEGGIFHKIQGAYLFLIAYIIGYAVTRGRILTGAWDLRFVAIILALFFYLFLTGYRFGAFYVLITFALVPMAALFVAPRIGVSAAPASRRRSFLQRLARSRKVVSTFGVILVSIVLLAMVNSLLFVRSGDAQEALLQRLLVQPVHLYWLTWARLQNNEIDGISISEAWNFMFNDPFDAARNTGIQYLMFLHLGLSRASQVYEDANVDYAGGYPEILIEVGGLGIAIAAAIFASVIVAVLYRICVVSVCRGQFLSSVLSIYVCFGVINLFLGGMINFLTAGSYWVKVSALIVALGADRFFESRRMRILPWVLIPRNALLLEVAEIHFALQQSLRNARAPDDSDRDSRLLELMICIDLYVVFFPEP